MKKYGAVLRFADFRRIWSGVTLSMLGDGASWTALAWIAVTRGGAGALALLGILYTAPIILGGALAGLIVDRVSRRLLLITDSVVRGCAVGCLPVLAATGQLRLWELYAAAAVCGLLKILPIGIVPAVLPSLVPAELVPTAIALEVVSQGITGLAGPALGGVLIPLLGAEQVLGLAAVSFLLFAVFVRRMDDRLVRPAAPEADGRSSRSSWVPVFRLLGRDRQLLAIVLALSASNVALGMLTVTQPWLAEYTFAKSARTFGLLVAVFAGAELVGSLIAGSRPAATRPMVQIGRLRVISGAGLLFLLVPSLPTVLIGQVICGWAGAMGGVPSQTVRFNRTPPELWARTMTLMRTLILGAIPLGSVIAGPLLAGGRYRTAVLVMAALSGLPGLALLFCFRSRTPVPAATTDVTDVVAGRQVV
ncbi:MFS transporter [Kitasatospora mediocidica]|uniref:MFS transporter n=1 Tax=Kitasatospora mediocidica TaxID=58352 RepID=UPI00068D4A42|nr:MFS transporter [Kitasatospora mediocidica]